jgi:hypothetical protein
VRIIGVTGPDGQKPVIRGKLTSLKVPLGSPPKSAFPAAMLNWQNTNKNLTLENIAIEQCGECLLAGSRSLNKQIIRLTDVDIRWCRGHCILIGWEQAGKEDDEIYIRGGEFAYGGGNHVVYLDRTLFQEVIGATIHSPGTLHAIKAIGITINLIGNVISSVKPDGTVQASRGLAYKYNLLPYTGSAPLSLIACQRGVVAYNTVVFRYDASRTGGNLAIRQPRKALHGCDIPLDLTSTAFWQAVRAGGVDYPDNVGNKLALPMYWYANRFTLAAATSTTTDPNFYVKKIWGAYAIRNQSTYPVGQNPLDPGSWKPFPLPLPNPLWVERAYDFILGNCFENWMPGNIRSDLLTATMLGPDGNPLQPGERQWELGLNTCANLPARPAWMPERLPVMTRADYGY